MTTIDTARLRALAEAAHSDAEPKGSRDPKAWAAYLRAVAAFQVAAGPPTLIALLDRLEAATAYVADPGNWSALDGRRRLLLAILNGEDPR